MKNSEAPNALKNDLPGQGNDMQSERQILLDRFGGIPDEQGLKRRNRIHQGWWRMNVLIEKPGAHPMYKNSTLCSAIRNGDISKKNFLTANTIKAVECTVAKRNDASSGMIQLDRLHNNLLSSQPLCFNFFGELMENTGFGLKVLQNWWPELTELKRVVFEYAPEENYTSDNSAFDVAFEVAAGHKSGLIGLECKYTDTFSSTDYHKSSYREIYEKSSLFATSYEELKASKYNQLFRNELIGEALLQNNRYDFVRTGLFCFESDESAVRTAQGLKNMLRDPERFKIITYRDFIEKVQRLDLDWEKREWTMLLWARYCGTVLSDYVNSQIE